VPVAAVIVEACRSTAFSAQTVSEPALRLAEVRQRPWWR